MPPYSIYLHIPFCIHRCAYCDFNTYAGLDDLIPEYVTALCREIELVGRGAGSKIRVHTLFVGGGTPSLLPGSDVARIIETVSTYYHVEEGAEISLEANPGTVSLEYLKELRRIGVNRISLGMQSANPGELRLLERQHGFSEVLQAVTWARTAEIDNVSLDLIFGLPYQSLAAWQQNLRLGVGLAPDHLSLYALTLEHGTPMHKWVTRGLLDEPDPDLAADMYEWAAEYLQNGGYQQYEISNWAHPDLDGKSRSCRHNLQYWHLEPYLGFGAGAHGYVDGVHTINVLSPANYIHRLLDAAHPAQAEIDQRPSEFSFLRTPATQSFVHVDPVDQMGEYMMMGLRLTQEGISNTAFLSRFQNDLEQVYAPQIQKLVRLALLEWDGAVLRLTSSGRLLGNQVFMEFI